MRAGTTQILWQKRLDSSQPRREPEQRSVAGGGYAGLAGQLTSRLLRRQTRAVTRRQHLSVGAPRKEARTHFEGPAMPQVRDSTRASSTPSPPRPRLQSRPDPRLARQTLRRNRGEPRVRVEIDRLPDRTGRPVHRQAGRIEGASPETRRPRSSVALPDVRQKLKACALV